MYARYWTSATFKLLVCLFCCVCDLCFHLFTCWKMNEVKNKVLDVNSHVELESLTLLSASSADVSNMSSLFFKWSRLSLPLILWFPCLTNSQMMLASFDLQSVHLIWVCCIIPTFLNSSETVKTCQSNLTIYMLLGAFSLILPAPPKPHLLSTPLQLSPN